MYMQ